ncbi:basic proline-rich protein-like [Phyllostomus discolor]|uniref:Basic proline-rich protein-like n=1 Tax=Phyllostomus discolor TaxID=89673 RepID=A0A6J2NBG0_9CHIR|nr:basic proline-rich protein-like [Phyllostomus discolor]
MTERVTSDGQEWEALGVSMTPPPACNSAPTESPPGLPGGTGQGAAAHRDHPWPPPPAVPRGPREKCPRGVTVARRPRGRLPLPPWGPEGLSLQGRGEGEEKRGRWRANPEPPGPPPAPSPGPNAPPAHMPAPRKLSQGRARLGAAAVRPPAPGPRPPAPTAARPARPERPARCSSFPSVRGAPRPPPPALTRARPARRAAAPLRPASHPACQCTFSEFTFPLCLGPPERAGASILATPHSAGRLAPSSSGGGRARAPGLPAAPRRSPLAGASGCSLRPPRAPGLVSRALAQRWSASFLSQGLRVSPPLPALPTPPSSPNSPASRRLRDATPVPRALRQQSPHTQQPSRRRTALPRSAQGGQSRPGVERQRPPPAARLAPALAAPREGAVTRSVGHAVRCRQPSALTFAAKAVAEAAAAMFPC